MTLPQYALVAYVKNSVGEWVQGLRRELEPGQEQLPAHITVLPPRPLAATEESARERLEEICSAIQPFEVTMGEVGSFIPTTPTVFIRVAQAAYRMRELHDKLNIGALHCEEQWPYMPHLTIAKLDRVEDAIAARDTAIQRWAQYEGKRQVRVDEVTFVREAAGQHWIDLAPIPLGRRLASVR